MKTISLSLMTASDIVTFTWDQDSVLISRTHTALNSTSADMEQRPTVGDAEHPTNPI